MDNERIILDSVTQHAILTDGSVANEFTINTAHLPMVMSDRHVDFQRDFPLTLVFFCPKHA